LKNPYFSFCNLCFKTPDFGVSKHFCSNHLPKRNLYLRDRIRLKDLASGRFEPQSGHLDKINLLSEVLDEQAASPEIILSSTTKVIRNGSLKFDSAFEMIRKHFSYADEVLRVECFNSDYSARWFEGFLHRIGAILIETKRTKIKLDQTQLFEAIVFMSARYQAYRRLDDIFIDRRQRKFRNSDASKEDQEILLAIQKTGMKSNGRVNRSKLASECGMNRHKIGRIIERLKSDGELDNDM
jgi:predicted transcriptional regulator